MRIRVAIITGAATIAAAIILVLPHFVGLSSDGKQAPVPKRPSNSAPTSLPSDTDRASKFTQNAVAVAPSKLAALENGAPFTSRPTIQFITVPPRSGGDIAGIVSGLAEPERYAIVIYAKTNHWFVQPLITAPYTSIDGEGRWYNATNRGDIYAVLLVSRSYQPASEALALPPVGGAILARVETEASNSDFKPLVTKK